MKPSLLITGDLTRDRFVSHLLELEGIDFSPNGSAAWKVEGRWVGAIRCHTLPILALMNAGNLPLDFDYNLPPSVFGQSDVKTMAEMLRLNCDKIERDQAAFGDFAVLRYTDCDPLEIEPHHLGVFVPMPDGGLGIFHASARKGSVVRQRFGAEFEPRLERVLTLKILNHG